MSVVLKLVPAEKICSKCGISKELSGFYVRAERKCRHTSQCKDCIQAANREGQKHHKLDKELQHKRYKKWREGLKTDPVRYAKYKDKKTKWNRSSKYYDSYFKRKFGVSLDVVTSMLSSQNGLCANLGCSKAISLGDVEGKTRAVVDHCHVTGKVRALMCVRYNSLLGHIENNSALIPGLMDYLNKHSSVS